MQEEKYLEGLKQWWYLVSTAMGEETAVFVREERRSQKHARV